jgi:hypothetical protein
MATAELYQGDWRIEQEQFGQGWDAGELWIAEQEQLSHSYFEWSLDEEHHHHHHPHP